MHGKLVELPDCRLESHGIAIALFDRLELSYARQNFDTKAVGVAVGLGEGFKQDQDIYGAKLRVLGDVVHGDPAIPQISVGTYYRIFQRYISECCRRKPNCSDQ